MMLTILFINLKVYLRCSNSLIASEQDRIKQAIKTVNLTQGFTFAPILPDRTSCARIQTKDNPRIYIL